VAAALVALALALRALCAPRRATALTAAFQPFTVAARRVVNPAAPRPVIFLTLRVSTASLPTGAHVRVRARVRGGATVSRSYTPTRFDAGACELMVRVYEGGPMSTHLEGLRVGDSLDLCGPTGLERYGPEPGTFSRGARMWHGITHVGMLAGGTGVTPMLQIANAVVSNERDATRLALVAFSTGADDVLLEDELRALEARAAGRLNVTFAASTVRPRDASRGVVRASMRKLDADALARLLAMPAADTTLVCVCGPDGFVERARELLKEAGFENVIVW
jgi:cytochrome-b5 reductase